MTRTVIFDVNETLSDPSPLAEVLADLGATGVTASTWLAATLRDGFALSLTTGGASFPEVAQQVLVSLLSTEEGLTCGVDDAVEQVMTAFTTLPVHPDVVPAVRALRAQGHRVVALSNGTSEYARSLLWREGVDDAFESFLSVDDVGVWKPDPRTYRHALARTSIEARDAVLVAAHPWDLHGARLAGLATVHVDRTGGAPWPAVFAEPDLVVRSLVGLQLPRLR